MLTKIIFSPRISGRGGGWAWVFCWTQHFFSANGYMSTFTNLKTINVAHVLIFMSFTINLSHIILIPIILMPKKKLSFRTICIAVFGLPLSLVGTLVGFAMGFAAGIPVTVLLGGVSKAFQYQNSYGYDRFIEEGSVFIILFLCFFAGGAACATFTRSAIARLTATIHPTTTRSAAIGGGIAALVALFVIYADSLMEHFSIFLLSVAGLIAGLPHLLLMCRDLQGYQLELASFRVATSRLMILLLLIGMQVLSTTLAVDMMREMRSHDVYPRY